MTDRLGGDFRWLSGVVMAVSHQGFRFELSEKNDYVFGSVCHSNEMHNSFETGDHLKTFGAALEPAPQGFEENEKMREALGETAIQ